METTALKTTVLSLEQARFYEENGYLFPLRAFSEEQAAEFRVEFDNYTEKHRESLKDLLPRQRRSLYSQTHLVLPWVYQITSHPNVLDAVEGVIGPDILVWESAWFVKFPHDRAFISWHQDGAYLGLHPPKVATAWVALCPSNAENGCMQVMPGSPYHEPSAERYLR